MKARVTVRLKSGVLDPQGLTIQKSLRSLGYEEVGAVRQGKVFEVEMADGAEVAAAGRLDEMCRRLLANPVIEEYQIEWVG